MRDDVAGIFDELIEEMIAGLPRDLSRRDAVELFEIVLHVNNARRADGRAPVELPPLVSQLVLESAKRGMHEGKGRPAKSYVRELIEQAVIEQARERKDYLHDVEAMPLTGANSAEDRAAREACELLCHVYNDTDIEVGSIKDRMNRSDPGS